MADIELTVKQASAELRTSERNVRRWLADGRLVGRRVGRGNLGQKWRVDADSVRKLAAARFGGQSPKDKAHGKAAGKLSAAAQVAVLADQVRSLREEGAEYRQVIERQAIAISDLASEVRQMQRLLMPAPEEVTLRPRWWQWWLRRGEG